MRLPGILLLLLIGGLLLPRGTYADGRGDARIRGPVLAVDSAGVRVGPVTFLITDSTEVEDGSVAPGDVVNIRFHYDSTAVQFIALKMEREDDPADVIRIEGEVIRREDSTVVISGIPVRIGVGTVLRGDGHMPVALEDIAPGQEVRAHAVYLPDADLLVAVMVKVERGEHGGAGDGPPHRKIEGTVVSVGEGFLEIVTEDGDTLEVHVPPGVHVRGEHGRKLTFSDIEVGASLEIRIVRRMDGTLVAVSIEVEMPHEDRDFRLVGTLTRVDSSSIQVDDHVFMIDPGIEIENEHGEYLTLGDLQAGMLVRVEGYVQRLDTALVLVATEIRILPAHRVALGREHRLRGAFTRSARDTLFVEGIGILVRERTRFRGISGVDALSPGDPVEVYFHLDDAGNRVALVVRRKDAPDEPEMRGRIDAVDAAHASAIGIAGVTFLLTDTTDIRGRHGDLLSPQALKEGMRVRVRFVTTDTGYVATRVRVRHGLQVSAQVTAVVQGATDLVLRLPTQEVHVTEETVILGPGGEVLDLASLSADAFVDVLAVETEGTGKTLGAVLEAERVQVLSGVSTAVEEASLPVTIQGVVAYPNPFVDHFTLTISVDGPGNVRVVLYDLLGRVVGRWSQVASTAGPVHVTVRPVETLAPGIYLFRVDGGDGQPRTGKVVHVR